MYRIEEERRIENAGYFEKKLSVILMPPRRYENTFFIYFWSKMKGSIAEYIL
jgi:hypothetical protein